MSCTHLILFFKSRDSRFHLFFGIGEEIREQRQGDQTDHLVFSSDTQQIYTSNFNIIFTLFIFFSGGGKSEIELKISPRLLSWSGYR